GNPFTLYFDFNAWFCCFTSSGWLEDCGKSSSTMCKFSPAYC
ncbi:hypothetical protein CP8484711_1977, partial [Chlamydia psittaci 84-8471/1]